MKWLRAFCYVVAFFIVFVLSTAVTIRLFLQDVPTVSCPDVTGLDYEEAKRVAENTGLSAVAIKYEPKKDVPYNRVLAQKPDATVPVREGRTISVILSDGPRPTTIPQLVGLSVEEAQGELEARGMPLLKVLYVPNTAVGKVLAQAPPVGEGIVGDGLVLVVGGREKRFLVMPDIAAGDGPNVLRELETKGIRYSVATPGLPEVPRENGQKNRAVPKTIFNEDAAVELPAGVYGGGN
jgi:beta-lactam-binding protein with PASTA domain